MKMRATGMAVVLTLGAMNVTAACAQAANPAAGTAPRASEIGHSTRAWLALQVDGTAAAPAQPTPGAEAGAAYDRYLKSFGASIPASFGSTLSDGGAPSLNVNYKNAGGQN
jgi:Protein of unknown function (DUF3613)